MDRRGILFVISGPSGVGKGTIREELLKNVNNLNLSVSATTRSPREGEVDGRDYYYVSKDKFQQMADEQQFLEYAHVYNNMYGTPRPYVVEKLEQGQDVLLEIDIQGAMQIKKTMPDAVYIFIKPPSIDELVSRLCGRGKDTQESIERRLVACQSELLQVVYYDYVVVNDDLNDAVRDVQSIIQAERCRIKYYNLKG
ncbi:MAG: guanylate kinase [Bacillota bacterium]|nr:guanylate kinase [Bacillota bacterium]